MGIGPRAAAVLTAAVLTLGALVEPVIPAAAAPPTNDGRAGATAVTTLPAEVRVDTTEATLDADEAGVEAACDLPATPAVWLAYRTRPGYQQRLRALVVAFKGIFPPIATVQADGSVVPVACPGDAPPPLEPDTTYYVLVLKNDFGGFGVDLSDVTCFPLPGATAATGGLPPCPAVIVGAPGARVAGRRAAGLMDQRFWRSHEGLYARPLALAPGSLAGGQPAAGAGFGSVIATGLVDDDDLTDVVIGAPDEAVAGRRRAGAVHVVFGSAQGLGQGRPSLVLTRPLTRVRAGDRFGAAVAVDGERHPHRVPPDVRLTRLHAVAVGAPGVDRAGRRDAGAVAVYRFTGASRTPEILTQGHGLAGTARAGNRVGAAVAWLSGSSFDATVPDDTLVVGAPGADTSRHRDAGAVLTWTSRSRRSRTLDQDSPGMPDRAESGDRFGAALAAGLGESFVAVGAPGEDVAGVRNAGAVGLLGGPVATGPVGPCRALSLATPGVAGAAARDDGFGAVLSVRVDAAAVRQQLVVGVPRKDVGRRRDAGAVSVINLPASCRAGGRAVGRLITQASRGVPGDPDPGDRFGAAVATVPRYESSNLPFEGLFGVDVVFVGAPGEDVGGRPDAGVVVQLLPTGPTLLGPNGTPQPHARFGAAVG